MIPRRPVKDGATFSMSRGTTIAQREYRLDRRS